MNCGTSKMLQIYNQLFIFFIYLKIIGSWESLPELHFVHCFVLLVVGRFLRYVHVSNGEISLSDCTTNSKITRNRPVNTQVQALNSP